MKARYDTYRLRPEDRETFLSERIKQHGKLGFKDSLLDENGTPIPLPEEWKAPQMENKICVILMRLANKINDTDLPIHEKADFLQELNNAYYRGKRMHESLRVNFDILRKEKDENG